MTDTFDTDNLSDEDLRAMGEQFMASTQAARAAHLRSQEDLREKARSMSTWGPERFSNGVYADPDRFAAKYVDVVRCDTTGRSPEYYLADSANRWVKCRLGQMTQLTRVLVDEALEKSAALSKEAADLLEAAQDADDDEKKALKAKAEKIAGKAYHLTEVANRLGARGGSRQAITMGTETYGMCVEPDITFDQDPHVLACGDQLLVFNGASVAIRPIEREDYVTKNTGTNYDPRWLTETPLLMQQYYDTFMPDPEVQRAFWKIGGASLIGVNLYRLLVVILGSTTSGKGQLTDKIDRLLGDYATTANPSIFRGNLDEKPRADLLKVMKVRVAFLSEASKHWSLHVDRIKDMTGQSKISARTLHSGDYQELVPEFTPFLVTNEMPNIPDADAALARRMLVIPFNHTVSVENEDTSVRDRFMEDQDVAEYILCQLVEGYKRAMATGIADVKALFDQATKDALSDLSHLRTALEAMVEGGYIRQATEDELATLPDYQWITAKEVVNGYSAWVKAQPDKETRDAALGRNTFNKALAQQPGWEPVDSHGKRWRGWLPGPSEVADFLANIHLQR